MIKYRTCCIIALSALVLFLGINIIIYYGFTSDTRVPVRSISENERLAYGDLSRLSYLNGLRHYVKLFNNDSTEYIGNNKLKNFPIYTIGDSYTDYPDYPTRIASLISSELMTNVYNMTGQTVGAMMNFIVSDTINSSSKPKVVIWEVVERTAACDHMTVLNFDKFYNEALKIKKIVKSGRVYSSDEEVKPYFTKFRINSNKKQFKWYDLRGKVESWSLNHNPITSINLKFIINNLSYYTTGKLIRGSDLVNIVHLKNGDPLLFLDNERGSFLYGYNYVNQTAEFVAKVNAILKEKGITLIFYVVPDKYNAYYNLFEDKYKSGEDHDFMGKLTYKLKEKGVHTFNLLPEFREKIEQGQDDVYIVDDSHWGMGGKQIAVNLRWPGLVRQPEG